MDFTDAASEMSFQSAATSTYSMAQQLQQKVATMPTIPQQQPLGAVQPGMAGMSMEAGRVSPFAAGSLTSSAAGQHAPSIARSSGASSPFAGQPTVAHHDANGVTPAVAGAFDDDLDELLSEAPVASAAPVSGNAQPSLTGDPELDEFLNA
jgi:hypothetical protein